MSTQENMELDDSAFKAYAQRVKEDADKKPGGNFPRTDYIDVKWSGLETGKNKFYRLIGAPPGLNKIRRTFDAIELNICDVKSDDGKRMQIKLPLHADQQANDHILHRLYAKITEAEWINKKRINKYENKYPELWLAATKLGFKPEDGPSFTYATGLKPRKVVVFNCIDRMDDWCKDNKKTKLLSKIVNTSTADSGDIIEYPATGIPSFGFINKLAETISKYGNYEKFDIAIKKTGDKTSPYEVRNVSYLKGKDSLDDVINDDGTDLEVDRIIVGGLTDEELAYERYDLDKLMKPTSHTKLLRRIPAVFKLCDACLGSHFYDELESLSEAEKVEWAKLYGTSDEAEAEQKATETSAVAKSIVVEKTIEDKKTDLPKRESRKAVGTPNILSEKKIALLKGWGQLTDEQRSWIKDVKVKPDGTIDEIEWIDEKADALLYCDNCNILSPNDLTVCPACSSTFV
jgi:hypothetical protein